MSNYNFETLTLEIDERGVARLDLNRPEKHNALNSIMISELRHAATDLATDDRVRVVILSGQGKSFCAGGDINWFKDNVAASRAERVNEGRELALMLSELNALPKPLIGRIQGPAYGGGVGMISVCDIAIADTRFRFGLTEVRLGLIPATISPYVVSRIGVANARATMLSGQIFNSEYAAKIGLVNAVVEQDWLDGRIEEIITDHLEAAPGAVAETKRLITYVSSHGMADNMVYTADRLADAWETDEGASGIGCFLEKRLPPWRSGK